MDWIYLDHHATTPMADEVLAAMSPYFSQEFGNPSSRSHVFGWHAEAAVKAARQEVADSIGADAREIVFTSGATEANNLAVLGLFASRKDRGHWITTNVEHSSVLELVPLVRSLGHDVTVLAVDGYGQVSAAQVQEALQPHTQLLSLLYANNEIGTVNPINEIAQLASEHKVLLHTDAVQAMGKIPIDVKSQGIHLLSFSAHKIYGPKGIGALYVRKSQPRVRLSPLIYGGGQEGGLRSGTENVPGIIGLAAACRLAKEQLSNEPQRLKLLRDQLQQGLQQKIPGCQFNGHPAQRLCNNLSVSFSDLVTDLFWQKLHGLATSSGSACATGSTRPSHVLSAIGVDEATARTTLRLGLGRTTSSEQIIKAIEIIEKSVLTCKKPRLA